MNNESFNIRKLFDLSPIGFYKVFGLAIKVGLILLIIMGVIWVKNLLLPPPETHTPTITGQNVNYYEGSKRRLEFFAGPAVSTDTDGDFRVGAFCGVKW